jgi:TatD-related deoxyribonuclease
VEGIAGLPVVDHHCHLSPSHEGVRAVERFRAAGGTHLFLATQNYEAGVPTDLDAYRRQFETTEQLAAQARERTGVVVYVVVAPYPIDLLGAAERLGVPAALELHERALDLAGRWVRDGRAVALGEVGWPHFPVPAELEGASQRAFHHALEVARDAGCPAIVHSPDLDEAGWQVLGGLADRLGLPRHHLVKHYARSRRPPGAGDSIVPSYLAKRELVREVLADDGPWFLETDFLDDPRRPGAVLDLTTVPRRAAAIARGGPDDAARLTVPFVRSIQTVYGFAPQLGGG